jgi:hypothetical protein
MHEGRGEGGKQVKQRKQRSSHNELKAQHKERDIRCVKKIKKPEISNKEKGRMKMMNTHVQISDWEGIQT